MNINLNTFSAGPMSAHKITRMEEIGTSEG